MLRDFPDTKYAEELEYLIVKGQYEYANVSREERKEERFNQAITYADQFAEKYENSKYLKVVADLKGDSQRGIVRNKRLLAEASVNPRLAEKIAKKDTTNTGQPPSVKGKDNQKIPANN